MLGIVLVALADATRRVNAQGLLTVAVFGLACILTVPALARGPRYVGGRVMPPIWLVLFFAWAALSLTFTPARFQGTQNLLVYGIFVMTIAITSEGTRRSTPLRLLPGYRNAGLFIAALYLPFVLTQGPNNNLGVYTARAAAGSLVLPIVAALALIVFCRERRWPLAVLG